MVKSAAGSTPLAYSSPEAVQTTGTVAKYKFTVTVALHDHCAVEHAERGEQGRGAVPLVIVRHGLATPRFDRQSRLGAIEGLDLALFVNRQHDRMGRRIDIEPDNVSELAGKAWIARALEGAQPMWLQFVSPPNALYRTY